MIVLLFDFLLKEFHLIFNVLYCSLHRGDFLLCLSNKNSVPLKIFMN